MTPSPALDGATATLPNDAYRVLLKRVDELRRIFAANNSDVDLQL
jgi:hypothetical protein